MTKAAAVRRKNGRRTSQGSAVPLTGAARRTSKPAKRVVPRAASAGPSPHEVAVASFERAFRALQARQFTVAAGLFASVIRDFVDERDLHERARVYLNLCQRRSAEQPAVPRSFEERMYAATIAINRGTYDEGLALLRELEAEEPANDHVHFMLSVAHTLRDESALALAHVRQAIELNPENRSLAAQDVDLEPLRRDAAFAALLSTPPARRRALQRRR